MPIPEATVTLHMPIDLSTAVKTLDLTRPSYADDDEYDHEPVWRTITLGQLIAETLIDQADQGGLVMAATRALMQDVTEDEIRRYARERIVAAGGKRPGETDHEDLTLMAMVEAEITRQLTSADGGAVTRGQPTPVIAALIAANVRVGLQDLTSEQVQQIRDRILGEIGVYGRSGQDPVPPGG